MPQIKVYHNPNFLDYRGRHADIVPPTRPVATAQIANGTAVAQASEIAYRQTQHVSRSWWDNDGVLLHVRSTSVGDVLADEQENLFVVEPTGFRPYQPRAVRPPHRLAAAYRLLESVLFPSDCDALPAVVAQVQHNLRHVLAAAGHPQRDVPILWEKALAGDLVNDPLKGEFRVIARRLHPKWRARQLLEHVPQGQIWIDSSRSWAVLVPVDEPPRP